MLSIRKGISSGHGEMPFDLARVFPAEIITGGSEYDTFNFRPSIETAL
jgi:hypothetical protein